MTRDKVVDELASIMLANLRRNMEDPAKAGQDHVAALLRARKGLTVGTTPDRSKFNPDGSRKKD